MPLQKCGENRKSGILMEGHLASSVAALQGPPVAVDGANSVPPSKGGVQKGEGHDS